MEPDMKFYLFLLLLLLVSCDPYSQISPVYLDWVSFRNSTEILTVREIQSQGKIFATETAIFISEPNVGIHVIDNSDPANPKKVSFIRVLGNLDMTGKETYLYADSFVDLLVFDISDIYNIQLVKREENVFPYDPYQTFSGNDEFIYHENIDKSRGVIIGWLLN
jgi:hypothetical protein